MHPDLPSRHPGTFMRQTRPSVVLVLGCLLLAACPARAVWLPLGPDVNKGAVHRQIEQLEQQWRAAVLSEGSQAEAALLADSYVGIGPDGTISSKSEELEARANGREHLDKYDVEDRKIRGYGSTAVVTSKVRIQGIYSGQPLLGEYRYTRVWSLSHGQWRIVSFEAGRIHDSSARRD